jgi:putative NADH-flavin reductase|mmetsp:Transcript_6096/g.12553  ORF Transcript_6096/g.12553 Transcript_6096/m.12553 type:complete len:262 (-) Transcript_6096:162-947(-)
MMTKTIAILYATKGGMGDVGKFVMTLATLDPSYNVRQVALSIESSSEGTDKGLEVDVEDLDLKKKTEEVLAKMEDTILKIDIAKDSAQEEIAGAIEGADAVISCLGNRQPSMERWCSLGTQKVIGAMKAKKVERLVSLSSFGIGTDFLKTSAISVLWRTMLRTILRSARKDLLCLEQDVRESGLDFCIVRPVGLTPSEVPQGSCDQVLSKEDGNLEMLMSKSDAAAFMLKEALEPTIHGKEVTIGYSTTRKTAGKEQQAIE